MELLGLLGGLLALGYLTLPLVSFLMARATRARLEALETQIEERNEALAKLWDRVDAAEQAVKALHQAPVVTPDTPQQPTSDFTGPLAKSYPGFGVGDSASNDEAFSEYTPAVSEITRHSTEDLFTATPEVIDPTAEDTGSVADPSDSSAGNNEPPEAAAKVEDQRKPEPISTEQLIAAWLPRAGAGAVLLGLLYFFKYAVDNEWIGPMGRVLIGVIAGIGLLVGAETMKNKVKPGYQHLLSGIGLACLFVSSYAAHAFYDLVGSDIAFGANSVILLLGCALAYRNKAEVLLALVLIAGFANPILLSTGEDRARPFFLYLLLMTSAVLAVSVLSGFKIVSYLALGGTSLLFAGWHAEHYHIFDHRELNTSADVPIDTLVGWYHPLTRRLVPIGFVAAFTAQWILATSMFAQRAPQEAERKVPRWIKALATGALVVTHFGVFALLYDRALPLGIGIIVVSLVTVVALSRLDAERLLIVPLLAAFALVAGTGHRAEGSEQTTLFSLLGLWTVIYVAAFLKKGLVTGEIGRRPAIRAMVALGAFAVLAALMLLPAHRYLATAMCMTYVSAAGVAIAVKARQPIFLLPSLILSFLPFVAGADHMELTDVFWDPKYLGVALLWAGCYLAGALILAQKEEEPPYHLLLTLAAVPLTFTVLCLAGTAEEVPTLRALLTGFSGVIALGLAQFVTLKLPKLELWTSVLAALALGLLSAAAAFSLSGVTITIAWGLLTVVAAFIVNAKPTGVWKATTIFLGAITALRVLLIDVGEVAQNLDRFHFSHGRVGYLEVPVFFNQMAYGLLALGICFLASAFVMRKKQPKLTKTLTPQMMAGAFATIAYISLTALLIIEIRNYQLVLPPAPPIALDSEEFNAFMETVYAAKAAQKSLLALTPTVVLAIVAMLLLSGGFVAKSIFHRYLGLIIFILTLGKLVTWDIWNLPRIYQIIALTVVGILLLASGFLYARLKVLFSKDTGSAVLILLLAGGWASSAQAQVEKEPLKTFKYKKRAALEGIEAGEDHLSVIPLSLYPHSSSQRLFGDLRISGANQQEVPYFIRTTPARYLPQRHRAEMLDPGPTAEGGYRATFRVPKDVEHCAVELSISSGDLYLLSAQVETGASVEDMQPVAKDAKVWSVSGDRHRSSHREISYPRSINPLVRVTLFPNENESSQVKIDGADFWCDAPESIAPIQQFELNLIDSGHDTEKKESTYIFDAGKDGVPVSAVNLRIDSPRFARRARLYASSYRQAWPQIATTVLYRSSELSRRLEVSINDVRKRYFKLVVENKDDQPIILSGASAVVKQRQIIFKPTQAGAHHIYLGNADVYRPSYDLKDTWASRPKEQKIVEARIGEPEKNPSFGDGPRKGELPFTEKHRGTIQIILGILLLGLSLWAIRLLKKPAEDS